jgi:hypothetical protein
LVFPLSPLKYAFISLINKLGAKGGIEMMPGPDQIIACPKCKGLARYMTLKSGNTLDARVWTDSKMIAPMFPRPPAVVKCHRCAELYWRADAENIGIVDRWRGAGEHVNPAWADAPKVEEPTEEEYYQALSKGLAKNAKQERVLRIVAWWRRNDAFRDTPLKQAQGISNDQEAWRKNLEALARLLTEEDANDCLIKAEVLRELGEFESAKQVLSRAPSTDGAAVVRQLRSLCDAGDTRVRELHFSV